MPRLKRGTVEDLDDALDLKKMSRVVDFVGEIFEEFEGKGLTPNEALWASALIYLSTFNATDEFANTELLSSAARALLKEATDVFESLPDPHETGESATEPEEMDDETDEEDNDDDEIEDRGNADANE